MMRTPLRRNAKTVKVIRMKPAPAKKKQTEVKPERDFISETISFVIKGKLTPIKPTLVAKKAGIKKKVTKKKEMSGDKKPAIKKVKKAAGNSKVPKAESKVMRKPKVSKAIPSADKKVVLVKKAKEVKAKKVVIETSTKKKLRKSMTKGVKAKEEVSSPTDKLDQTKQAADDEDIKTKQTIEKLLKQANRALKEPGRKCFHKLKNRKCNKAKVPIKSESLLVKSKSKEVAIKEEPGAMKKSVKRKNCSEDEEDLTLKELSVVKKEPELNTKKIKVKSEPVSDNEKKTRKPSKKLAKKADFVLMKKRVTTRGKVKVKQKDNQRRMKLYGFWNGPKRHRVASLNAIAKVHCLYENETRSNLLDPIEKDPKLSAESKDKDSEEETVPCTRTLRSVPGLRAVGKHWDMHDTTSSSEDSESTSEEKQKPKIKKENVKKSDSKKPEQKKRRNRSELMMDLKDMVVRKRMASLNASAILAASYSVEKRATQSPKSDSEADSSDYFLTDSEDVVDKKILETKIKKEEDDKLIEVRTNPNKKVAVILNQDTDVTITGVYVNSTTRSTHHEGYCSIAGMQYRISATSHTQTAATAVATETLLQSSSSSAQENSNSESLTSCKSYTPLDALSNMQPPPGPGIQHQHMGPPQHVLPLPQHQLSPSRRHGCASAFSAPHAGPPYPPPPPPTMPGEPGYVHGYYQPAGPLISVPHGHTQQQPPPGPPPSVPTKSAALSETTPPASSPLHQPPPAPSSNGDSSDSEVIITSVTAGKETVPPVQPPPGTYRYSQYPATPPGYPYYPAHYYPTPPPAPSYAHHDLCYSTNPYMPHKYPPATYRRLVPPNAQYYTPSAPDLYATPPTAPPPQQSQQVVTASPGSTSNSTYQQPPTGPPPAIMEPYPPTLVEPYPPHPPHYYPTYAPAPPPPCYSHPPTATRTLPYINAAYQSCPCPMQSCPKNVHTGPLTGDSKRSNISSIAKDSIPLPPVALALPLEPASATGPPSPARGSAGMPPPPSPAGATYQPPPPAPKTEEGCNAVEKKRKARVGKAMVRNHIAAIQQSNTMLLMCHPSQRFPEEVNRSLEVKREIESPKEKEPEAKKEICSDDEAKEKIALRTTIEQEMTNVERLQEPQNLKKEDVCNVKEDKIAEEVKEDLPPCINTVAENVKVKNMKRKMSTSTEKKDEEVSPNKRLKLEDKYPNGSYKDLIKKDTSNAVRINNGRRKLISETDGTPTKGTKTRKATKRKLSVAKEKVEVTTHKRLKQTKPLTTSNQQNSKHYSKENKNRVPPVLIENKEPLKKRRNTVNSKISRKTAPALLDNLIARNSIDRTIDSVISEATVRTNASSALKTVERCVKLKEPVLNHKKSTNLKNGQLKSKVECRKSVVTRRKSKCKEVPQPLTRVPRRSLHLPRWSNGWKWEGEGFDGKVFLNSDETVITRKCFPAMRHDEGDIIETRDCVLLKAGPRKNDLPFVAKIAYLWENPDDGEMMMSLLWYYRPEHTEQGRTPADQPDEVFASRHKDSNSVACIDDKCYVLTFHEYCRYRKNLRRLEDGVEETKPFIPVPEPYPRSNRQPPSPLQVSSDMVFFCRRVYDFRQKRIVKNPS